MSNVHQDAAEKLGMTLVEKALRTQEEARAILDQLRKREVDGLLDVHFTSPVPV
jgi:hypothetical protein